MNSKKIRIVLIILGFLFVPLNFVFAYETETHAYLTKEAIDFYNNNFKDNKIPNNLEDDLINGSRHEDTFPRWMNHFYDPVHDIGLTSFILGSWQKSKDWAEDGENQNNSIYKIFYLPSYFLGIFKKTEEKNYSVFTWQKAIDYWVDGKNGDAMFTLGHILHLIEDASVPDHTRNDAHPGDSPYEKWTKQFNLRNRDKNLANYLQGRKPILLNSLNLFFDEIAKYANNNFYSKDTIGMQSGYKLPEVDYFSVEERVNYGMKTDREFGDYHLIKTPQKVLGVSFDNEEFLKSDLILGDYWTRLSTKAVQYSAGVINLFFKEAEKAKVSESVNKNSFFANIYEALRLNISSLIKSLISADETSVRQNIEEVRELVDKPKKDLTLDIEETKKIEQLTGELRAATSISGISEETREKLQSLINNLNDLAAQLCSLASKQENSPPAGEIVFGGGSPPVQDSENQGNNTQNQDFSLINASSSDDGGSTQSEVIGAATSTDASNTAVFYPSLNFNVVFNSSTKDLSFGWNNLIDASSSTVFITYKIYDISSSSEMIFETSSTTEFKKELNEFGRDYSFLLSAIDENSNEVASSSALVSVPEIIFEPTPTSTLPTTTTTRFYITQTEQNSWSEIIGRVSENSYNPDSASLQSFTPQEDFSFNKVILRFQCGERCGDTANMRLAVYGDNGSNAPEFSNLLGTAFYEFYWDNLHPAPDQDIIFSFDNPLTVKNETRYWFLLDVANYSDARAYFRERGSDWRNALMKGVDVYEWGDAGVGAGQGMGSGLPGFGGFYSDGPADWYMKIGLEE
ncbi:MAG: hypothetical protein QMD65_03280 [Patescibacteria group bacterium]|nr:hypothetical protein [Patescibacteria group bacterium]